MTVKELIELLQEYNPEAIVFVSVNQQIGDYTWEEEHQSIVGCLAWPFEDKPNASNVEIVHK